MTIKTMNKAKWIWANTSNKPDEYVRFIDEFEFDGCGSVKIRLSCDSNYALYLNGKLEAFGQYPDYPHYKVYDDVELYKNLEKGYNRLEILVWYYGESSQTYFRGNAGLIYEVVQEDRVLIYSCETTKCAVTRDYVCGQKKSITFQIGYSFRYDTRFSDYEEIFQNAVEAGGHPYELYPRPIKKLQLKPLTEAKPIDKGKRVYDLGRECAGFFKIRFRAPEGEIIAVSFGEHIEGGMVNRIIGLRDFSFEIIGNGKMTEYLNPFRRLGGRYLQVDGSCDCEIESIGICETPYPVERKVFHAKTPLQQKIYDTSVRTLELCMHEHYEDCPWREQALYTMDSRNQMLCGYYAFKGGNFEFARANLLLMSKARKTEGLLPLCFPAGVGAPIPCFSLIYLVEMEEYARFSGDISLCRDNIEFLDDIIMTFSDRLSEVDLIPTFPGYWNFYEWSEGLSSATDEANPVFSECTEYDIVLNSMFLYALQSYITIVKEYLKHSVKRKYFSLIKRIRKRINQVFYNPEKHLYRTRPKEEHYSEFANSLAILCGAADLKISDEICRILTEENDMIKATLSMVSFKYDALLLNAYQHGCKEKYNSYILDCIKKDYAGMLEQNATSFWETLEGTRAFGGAGSLCHGWSAMPIYYYWKLIRRNSEI